MIERRQGDSVEEIARYWGDKNIDEIHQQVLTWKSQQPPQLSDKEPTFSYDKEADVLYISFSPGEKQ